MQDNIQAYVQSLKVKDSTGYELAARECKEYFDGRGIEYPTAEDWKAFEVDYPAIYQSKRGKEISATTLQQNYVSRGKAYYRWCKGQAGMQEGTPSLFPEQETAEARAPEPPDDEPRPVKEEKQSDPPKTEGDKPTTRISLLLDTEIYRVLAVLSALEDKTMTAILTEGARLYIREHNREATIARGAIDQVRGQ